MTSELHHDLDVIRAEWVSLAPQAANVFATWEWNATWWRHFGSGRRPVVVAVRSPTGALRGLVPVYRHGVRPLRIDRLLGHGPADQAPLLHDASDPRGSLELLRAALSELPSSDVLVAEQVPEHDVGIDLADGVVVARQESPVVAFRYADWSEYLQSLGSSTRASLLRKERSLARNRTVEFRLSSGASDLKRDLDTLFALHRLRWPNSSFVAHEQFHREFAALAQQNGWLRLWFLEADGVPAAAWYGLRFSNTEHYYQSGWDPNFRGDSVGQVLLAHTIREALADGMDEYRFGRGGEAYKFHYANEVTTLISIAMPRSRLGGGATRLGSGVKRFRRFRTVSHALFDPR